MTSKSEEVDFGGSPELKSNKKTSKRNDAGDPSKRKSTSTLPKRKSKSGSGGGGGNTTMSETLARGLKMTSYDMTSSSSATGFSSPSESRSLAGTLKRALKSKSKESSNSSSRQTTSSSANMTSSHTHHAAATSDRSNLRAADVTAGMGIYDDAMSLIGAYLPDGTTIRPEDGMRDTFGRKGIVTMRKMVKLLNPDTNYYNSKVLLLTPYRCQLVSTRSPFKVEHDFHFLSISSLDSRNSDCLLITLKSKRTHTMVMIGSDDADQIIGRIALSCRTIFPGVSLSVILRASLEPVGRQKLVQNILHQADQVEEGPCGNFSEQYRCICDYLGSQVREEVQWDVDTIYLTQNCKEINLKDFDIPDSKDVAPIIAVLVYNKWFERLVIRDRKLGPELVDLVLKVIRNSASLKELVLDGVGLKSEFVQRMARHLMENTECCIELVDLSNNPIDDKGAIFLSGPLPMLKPGTLKQLKLKRTGMTSKGLNGLCQALRSNNNVVQTLTYLDLSCNSFKTDEVEGLYALLANENQLTDLNLSSTSSAIEVLVSAFSKGCFKKLARVDLSKNHFFSKKNKASELPYSFQAFFERTSALERMDLSEVKLPQEALRALLTGLTSNIDNQISIDLIVADCELKASGCRVLQDFVASLTNVTSLDISGNFLDEHLIDLLPCLQRNSVMKELRMGRNLYNVKSRKMREAMEAIVELIQEEDSHLEALSLADSKCREFLHMLLGCLGSNTSLRKLDISGNAIGDGGARVLAKSLQINARLESIELDRNNVTSIGFRELASAMENNYTLRYMPYPVHDVVATIKQHPEKTQTSLARIQDLLLRNANAHNDSSEQQFRLRRALTNTGQLVLDKVAEKTEDTLNALEMFGGGESRQLTARARCLAQDARNSRDLLSDIYGIGMQGSEGDESALGRKIEELAVAMDAMVAQHVEEIVREMALCARSHCPNIYEGVKEELDELLSTKNKLEPPGCVREHVMRSSGGEITSRVGNVNLQVATLISNKITDTLLAELTQANIALTDQLSRSKEQSQQLRSLDISAKSNPTSPLPSPQHDVDDVTTDDVTRLLPPSSSAPSSGEFEARRLRAESVAKRQRRPDANKETAQDGAGDSLDDPDDVNGVAATAKAEADVGDDIIREPDRKTDIDADEAEVCESPPPQPSTQTCDILSLPPPPEVLSGDDDRDDVAEAPASHRVSFASHDDVREIPPPEPEAVTSSSSDDSLSDKREVAAGDVGSVEGVGKLKEEEKEPEVEEKEPVPTSSLAEESQNTITKLEDLHIESSTSKLQHLTKGRAKGPTRRQSSRRVRSPRGLSNTSSASAAATTNPGLGVDDFFNKDVSTTDFSNVPTQEEEAELVRKENIENKMKKIGVMGGGLGGMMGGITPDMLNLKKRSSGGAGKSPPLMSPSSPPEAEGSQVTSPLRPRPPPPMGGAMPVGFLAELKNKNHGSKTRSSTGGSLQQNVKTSPSHVTSQPIGPGMLKKRGGDFPHKKSEVNSNNNNNNSNNNNSNNNIVAELESVISPEPTKPKSSFFGNLRSRITKGDKSSPPKPTEKPTPPKAENKPSPPRKPTPPVKPPVSAKPKMVRPPPVSIKSKPNKTSNSESTGNDITE